MGLLYSLCLFATAFYCGSVTYSYAFEVVFAVNCGGDAHRDIMGIQYKKDNLKVGTKSDFGRQLMIGRVSPEDQILYQTERYHFSTFGYEVPIPGDGKYVLIAKFSEVYFMSPGAKVFDIRLNKQHIVVKNLDIFGKVGKAMAHDEYIPFTVSDNMLEVQGEKSPFNGMLSIDFVKGGADNPKINAIVVIRGSVDEITKLPPLPKMESEEEDSEDWESEKSSRKFQRTSGPRTEDPYASDDSWFMPITIAIALFLPILFCLCRH